MTLGLLATAASDVSAGAGYTAVGQAATSATASNAETTSATGGGQTSARGVGGARRVPQITDFSLDARRDTSGEKKVITVGGYIQPTFGLRYRPEGLPRDQFDYSAAATQLGFIVSGEPVSKLSYTLHVVATGQILSQNGNPSADKSGGTADGKTPLFGALRPLLAAGGASQLSSGVRVE